MIYAAMGSKILTVNYNSDTGAFNETTSNATIDVEVIPSSHVELFSFTL